jgi:hypothetical protein
MIGWALNHAGMARRCRLIPVNAMVLHALLDKLVILCRPLITFGAVDKMDDAVDLSINRIPEQRCFGTAAEPLRELIKQIGGDAAKSLYTFERVGAGGSGRPR